MTDTTYSWKDVETIMFARTNYKVPERIVREWVMDAWSSYGRPDVMDNWFVEYARDKVDRCLARREADPPSVDELAHEEHGRYYCRACIDKDIISPARERYSMQCYAGMYCVDCWANDGRNHTRDHDFMDAGEHFSELDY